MGYQEEMSFLSLIPLYGLPRLSPPRPTTCISRLRMEKREGNRSLRRKNTYLYG